jgi:hypothetical protein
MFITLLTLSLFLAGFAGCVEDIGVNGKSEPPSLPPDASMIIDLSVFGLDKLGAPPEFPGDIPELPDIPLNKTNFAVAAATVSVVSSAVVAGLAIPSALFTAAKNETPVEQEDGSWLWSYSVTIESRTFTANLIGKEEVDETHWSMRVSTDSKQMPLEDFEWYTGISAADNQSGSWQFFDPKTPEQPNPTAGIEWEVGISLRGITSDLTFIIQKADSEHLGDVLHYKLEGEMASMSFTEVAKDTTTIIEWNLETTVGSITAPFYNDGVKACWDENQQNIDCE